MATVRYLVSDVTEAAQFFTAHLGFAEGQRWGKAFAIVERDDLKLWLSGPQSSAARPMPDGTQPAPGGWNRIVITVPDIHAIAAELKTAGIKSRSGIVAGPGGKQILIEDPSGNPIELFEPA